MAEESKVPDIVAVEGDEPVRRGRRGDSRLRLHLPARITTIHGSMTVLLTDLSTSGARIATNENLRPGHSAVLWWSGLEAFGEVRWCEDGVCGIGFVDPIGTEAVLRTRALDAEARMADPRDSVRRAAEAFVRGRAKF